MTDALTHTTTTAYDARGRVTRITSHDQTHTDFAYDTSGRRTKVTDPLGRATSYVYDTYGRLEKVIDAQNGTTTSGLGAIWPREPLHSNARLGQSPGHPG